MPASQSIWLTLALTLGSAILFSTFDRGEATVVAGACIGYLIAYRIHLSSRTRALERRLLELEDKLSRKAEDKVAERLRALREARPQPEPRPAPPEPAVASAADETPEGVVVTPAPVPEPEPAPAAAGERPPLLALPPAEPGLFEQGVNRAIAWFRRGNPLARVGIVILFFGAAFLAKYAAEHSLLPLELRLAAIAAGAIALLVTGWRMRSGRAVYAQILQGGGVAGLYLTVFAATRLYGLLPPGLALPLLVAIAVASAVLAVAQNALALAVIGFAGGFLAPVLLSTGGGSHVALFSYYTVLNLGVFAVAWFRAWRVLNLVGFVFTFTITGAWRALAYRPDQLVSADFFLLLFFVLYVAISILFALRQKPDLRGYVSASLVFGLPVVVFSLQASLLRQVEYGLAFSALGFGAFYVALAWALFRSGRENLVLLAEAFIALGIVFSSLAIPLAFDTRTTTAMWAVEGAGLVWIGLRQDRQLARAFGLLLQAAAGVGFLSSASRIAVDVAVLNSAFIGTLLVAVAGALTARWYQVRASALPEYEAGAATVAMAWAAAWWVLGGIAEIDRSVPAAATHGASLAFVAVTLAGGDALTRAWSWAVPRRLALVLLPAAAVIGLIAAARLAHPSANFGGAGWPLLVAAGAWLLASLDREPDPAAAFAVPVLHAGMLWLIAGLGGWEATWQLRPHVAGVWEVLPLALIPLLAQWLATSREPLLDWPLARHARAYVLLGATPLAAWSVLWLLAQNATNPGDPAPIPYLPLLNPLDMMSAAILMGLALWWLAVRRTAPDAWSGVGRREAWGCLAALAFLWLNAALVRALHHAFDTPLPFQGMSRSFLVQASLSIFWSLIGLGAMALATRRRWRWLWLVGAALMAVVVGKLFLVDLAGTGSLARIASFITVGVLFLVAGYISPLPPGTAAAPTAKAPT